MFGLFKRKKPAQEEFHPLGLKIGSTVKINTLKWRLLGDATLLELPEDQLIVKSHGTIMMADESVVHRFYTDDNTFIQLIVYDGTDVEDIRVYRNHKSIFPANEDDWDYWLGNNSKIGDVTFVLDSGETYNREWFEDSAKQGIAVPPQNLLEEVKKANSEPRQFELNAMGYGRFFDDSDNSVEWLLVQSEDNGAAANIEVYLGTSVSENDLGII